MIAVQKVFQAITDASEKFAKFNGTHRCRLDAIRFRCAFLESKTTSQCYVHHRDRAVGRFHSRHDIQVIRNTETLRRTGEARGIGPRNGDGNGLRTGPL